MVKPTSSNGGSKSLDSNDDDIFQPGYDSSASSTQSVFSPPVVVSPFFHAEASGSPAADPVSSPTFGVGPNNVTVTGAGGLSITLDFLTNVQTQAQETEVANAALILANSIKINTAVVPSGTVSLTYDVNFNGTGGGANAGPSPEYYYDYATVRTALLANEPGDPNLANLLTTLPTTGNADDKIVLSGAEAKVLGLTPPAAFPGDDGAATFATDIPDDALVGVALHELSHAMGRVPGGPSGADDAPDLFDLYRFTSAGNIYVDDATPDQQAYFSIDQGQTTLAQYGTQSDPSDYLNGGTDTAGASYANDPFNEFYTAGSTVQGLTALDLQQLDVLGFNTSNTAATPCYVTGTLIRTHRGDVPVERLRVGDQAVTSSGQLRPIVWIGHRRVFPSRHPDPATVHPVRVSAGAFGSGLPSRDLWLSPGHSVACDGALIPISHLINGRSVAQVAQASVEYWHVELDAHDVIFAEDLPAESYLDCGNRTAFINGGAFVDAHPDFRAKHWAETCLPLALEGAPVVAAKARLLAHLGELGHIVTREADIHIVADGRRFDPIQLSETQLAFELPAGAADIVLRSNVFVPAHTCLEHTDQRELGIAVARLQIDGQDLALDQDEACGSGWHSAEFDREFRRRWTRGAADLPAGARNVIVDLAGPGYYWSDPEESAVSFRLVATVAA